MYYRFSMGICLRYSRSEEEAVEILNDGFYKVMTNLDKYTYSLSFKGWLRKIMVNVAIDYYRKNEKHYNNVDISYLKNQGTAPDILGEFSESEILKIVQELPASYRMVFNLYVIEGYKHNEIAHMLEITAGTSRSNLNIARVKLMKALSSEFDKPIKHHGQH